MLIYCHGYSGQLSLAIPPWVGTMSTTESWELWTCLMIQQSWIHGIGDSWKQQKQRSASPLTPYHWGKYKIDQWLRKFLHPMLIGPCRGAVYAACILKMRYPVAERSRRQSSIGHNVADFSIWIVFVINLYLKLCLITVHKMRYSSFLK